MGLLSTGSGISSKLTLLTHSQRESIIRNERERRRLIRYQQVRQLSFENAAKIREKVKIAKQKKMEEIKKRITDAIVQRDHLAANDVPSSVPVNTEHSEASRRSRRLHITNEELSRAVRRHYEALNRLRQEHGREQRRRELMLERRRKACEIANIRSRRV